MQTKITLTLDEAKKKLFNLVYDEFQQKGIVVTNIEIDALSNPINSHLKIELIKFLRNAVEELSRQNKIKDNNLSLTDAKNYVESIFHY